MPDTAGGHHVRIFRRGAVSLEFPDHIRPDKAIERNCNLPFGSTEKKFNFLANHLAVSAPTVAELHRERWRVEFFFKWIERRLPIESFSGASENTVRTRTMWTAVTVCVLASVPRKQLGFSTELCTILHVSSLTLFERNLFLICLFYTY